MENLWLIFVVIVLTAFGILASPPNEQ